VTRHRTHHAPTPRTVSLTSGPSLNRVYLTSHNRENWAEKNETRRQAGRQSTCYIVPTKTTHLRRPSAPCSLQHRDSWHDRARAGPLAENNHVFEFVSMLT